MGNHEVGQILVVSASTSEIAQIKESLRPFHVVSVSNGQEAHSLLLTDRDFHVVIIDLAIEESQWRALLRTITVNPQYSHLCSIVLSEENKAALEVEALCLGATDYIRKPYTLQKFYERVFLHFTNRETQREVFTQDLIFSAVFYQSPVGITISYQNKPFDTQTDILFNLNPEFEKITGRSKEELLHLGWAKVTYFEDLERELPLFRKLQEGKIDKYEIEKRYVRPDGSQRWAHVVVSPLHIDSHQRVNYICLIKDITEEKELEKSLIESERSKSTFFSHLPGMAYRCKNDLQWTMEFVSDGCYELTGYHSEELLYNNRTSFNSIIVPKYRAEVRSKWKDHLKKKIPLRCEYEIITASKERKWVIEIGQGVYNQEGVAESIEGLIFDISNRKKIEQSLLFHIERELSTGLLNRASLERRLKEDLKFSRDNKLALLLVNVSQISLLTLRHGFRYALQIVKQLASLLSQFTTSETLLFSLYENQFVFYLQSYRDTKSLSLLGEQIAEVVKNLLENEWIRWGIGIVEIDNHFQGDAEEVLRNLLIASEKSMKKEEAEDLITLFDESMRSEMDKEQVIIRELSEVAKGVSAERLYLEFQPIVDLKRGKISFYEALARFESRSLGNISPNVFIPIAERTKLIIPLGEQIFIQALQFYNEMVALGHKEIGITVNISAYQFMDKNFVTSFYEIAKRMDVEPSAITLEITETGIGRTLKRINEVLERLQKCGFTLSLDDFGKGYSSFARERELSFTFLKIDKLFIDKLLTLEAEKAITADIISMAHKLGQRVIAEGVEHQRQREYLLKADCDFYQGYLFSKPLPKEKALSLLNNHLL